MSFLFVIGLYMLLFAIGITGTWLAQYFFSKDKWSFAFTSFFGSVGLISFVCNMVFN